MSHLQLSSLPNRHKLYTALPNGSFFRLLKLFPGRDDQPIRCELLTHNISTAPPYEAISYVWGDPTVTSQINCNDKIVDVTSNLNKTLKRFRYNDQERILWADALCIDQSSMAERAHQVNLMGVIYECATIVLIWLGEDFNNGAQADFALIQELNLYYSEKLKEFGQLQHIPQPSKSLSFMDPSRWKNLKSLLLRDWFERVWVLQEVGLARSADAFYGSASIKFSQIVEFLLLINSNPSFQSPEYHIVESGRLIDTFFFIWSTFDKKPSWKFECPQTRFLCELPLNKAGCSFFNILLVGSQFEASDSRDRVYAFLGHPAARTENSLVELASAFLGHPAARRVNRITRKIVKADYTKDLSEVYWDIAVKLMGSIRYELLLLSAVEHSPATDLNQVTVSWIPQWHSVRETRLIAPSPGTPRFYYAGLPPNPALKSIIDHTPQYQDGKITSGHLQVRGVIFDRILCFSEFLQLSTVRTIKDETGTTIVTEGPAKLLRNPVEAAWPAVNTGETSKKEAILAISLALVCGLGKNGDAIAENEMEAHLADFLAYCNEYCKPDLAAMVQKELKVQPPSSSLKDTATSGNASGYASLISGFGRNRRFFVTADGRHYGIGPAIMQEGDLCCVLVGAKVPFVLRLVQGKKHSGCCGSKVHYQLVGECYIHGVMRGEILKKRFEFDARGTRDIMLV
ncbi:MAG: hypothetical protein LQ351_003565 [Letrouitia transgressa]|nr:MAG: hypothetical protein LQ351_003565 [Letrouitia transgressa]